ncbi:Flavin containing amine oxidoreductase [Sphingobium faniae]|nr:Flavin containing amine oxidoreductase [Sphingobium faniae]
MPKVIIIGAGLSGLSAAHRMRDNGWDVFLFESDRIAGGRARCERRDGFVIDTGPDALSTAYTEYLAMCDRMRLSTAVVPSSPVVGIVRGGRLINIDSSRLLTAALTPALSLSAKLKLARGIWAMRSDIAKTDAFALVKRADDDDPADNAYALAERQFGKEAADYLIDPLVRLVTGTRSSHATALMVPAVLSAWSSPMINILGGLDALPNALAAPLNITFGANCDHVERSTEGVSATITINGQTHHVEADAAIVATQSDAATLIAPDIERTLGALLRKIEPLSLYTVALAYDRPTVSTAYAVQLPSAEYRDELVILLQHNKAPDRAPPGKSLITYYIDHKAVPRYVDLPDSEIVRRGIATTTSLMPELASSFRFASVNRWDRAGSLATPGYYRVIRDMTDAIDTASPVQLAGDIFGAGSMEAAVRGGLAAADRLLQRQRSHHRQAS